MSYCCAAGMLRKNERLHVRRVYEEAGTWCGLRPNHHLSLSASMLRKRDESQHVEAAPRVLYALHDRIQTSIPPGNHQRKSYGMPSQTRLFFTSRGLSAPLPVQDPCNMVNASSSSGRGLEPLAAVPSTPIS